MNDYPRTTVQQVVNSDVMLRAVDSQPFYYAKRLGTKNLGFWDDFNRKDTAAGSLGTPPSGSAYDMRGTGAVNAATQSNINNGLWVSAAGDITYATQTLPNDVTRIGCTVSWQPGNGGSSPGAFALLISQSKTGVLLIQNCAMHLIIQRTGWTIQVISGAAFFTIAAGLFDTPLADDGTPYSFEVNLSGSVCRFNFAGVVGACADARFSTLLGPYATFEHYYATSSVAELVQCHAVWAGGSTGPGSEVYNNDVGVVFANGVALTYLLSNTRLFYSGGSGGYNFFDHTGIISLLTLSDDGFLRVTKIRVTQRTPASAAAAGEAGEVCWDANFIYVAVAANQWKRVAIASW